MTWGPSPGPGCHPNFSQIYPIPKKWPTFDPVGMHNSPRLEYPPKRIAQLLAAIRSIPTSNPPQDIKYNFTCQFMTFHDFSIVLATIRCYTRNGRCVIFVGLGLYYLSVELAVQKHYNQWLSWHQGSCLARPQHRSVSPHGAPWCFVQESLRMALINSRLFTSKPWFPNLHHESLGVIPLFRT